MPKMIPKIKQVKKLLTLLLVLSTMVPVFLFIRSKFYRKWNKSEGLELFYFLLSEYVYTFTVAFTLIFFYLWLISILDKKIPWKGHLLKRIVIEFMAMVLIGTFVISIFFMLRIQFYGQPAYYRFDSHIFHVLITIILSTFLITIIEGINFFKQWKMSIIEAENLEKENARVYNESLKNKVNPDFLFNSLYRLHDLIVEDQQVAKKYVQEFSNIYRYTLENSDKLVIEAAKEINFFYSNLFILNQQMTEKLKVRQKKGENEGYIIPFSLREILNMLSLNYEEHNYFPEIIYLKPLANTLKIEVFYAGVVLSNYKLEDLSLQLKNEYSSVSDHEPVFFIDEKKVKIELPYIDIED